MEFFRPWRVPRNSSGVMFITKRDGRGTGTAFVLLANDAVARNAMTRHGQWIRNRYIHLFRSNQAEMTRVRRALFNNNFVLYKRYI